MNTQPNTIYENDIFDTCVPIQDQSTLKDTPMPTNVTKRKRVTYIIVLKYETGNTPIHKTSMKVSSFTLGRYSPRGLQENNYTR
jgi:hypothetical protein